MTNKYINFMGLDFNKIAEIKKSFIGFEKRIQINNDNFDDELFYFCCFMDYFLERHDNVSFPAYYKFCVSLDAYMYSLMYLEENASMTNLIGFFPGKLFWHTVDNGNDDIFYILLSFYMNEWKKGRSSNE
ncbi:hypothetical protein DTY81_20095 [Escherichia coli]|nr:hypothetical protein [Escherichia coli]ECA8979236.1 hypothetical protein [Salmonella enterica subsp. enterica serovar Mbandaka]EGT0561446.1 hypothetical protein [Salmonella enterica]ODQ12844.1 hypothetical protein BGK51_19760 [Shigella sp. FC569]ECJ1662885.1 hypothetical protein [Salmonella enterica subsp. enterica serovar Mbandaka]